VAIFFFFQFFWGGGFLWWLFFFCLMGSYTKLSFVGCPLFFFFGVIPPREDHPAFPRCLLPSVRLVGSHIPPPPPPLFFGPIDLPTFWYFRPVKNPPSLKGSSSVLFLSSPRGHKKFSPTPNFLFFDSLSPPPYPLLFFYLDGDPMQSAAVGFSFFPLLS